MAGRNDDDKERVARIDMILEELRLHSEDLKEIVRQARERAVRMHAEDRALRERAQRRHNKG